MDTIQTNEPNLHYREPPLLLRNEQGKKFLNVSAKSGEVFDEEWAARGLAIGDLNNDGGTDAVVSTVNGPAWVLMNETQSSNHWITLSLIGTKSNRDGIGAQVRVSTSEGDQFATVTTCSSYQSSSDKRLHFGLGPSGTIREVEIRWPSGIRQTLKDVKGDQMLTIKEESK
jgi:hypothetical protein